MFFYLHVYGIITVMNQYCTYGVCVSMYLNEFNFLIFLYIMFFL